MLSVRERVNAMFFPRLWLEPMKRCEQKWRIQKVERI